MASLLDVLNEAQPNSGPRARSFISNAENELQRIALKSPQEADLLREQLVGQIRNRDQGITGTLRAVQSLSTKLAGDKPIEDKPAQTMNADDAARSIASLVNISDEMNINIPRTMLLEAGNAIVKKDSKELGRLASSIESLVGESQKQMLTEPKELIQTASGQQFLVGSNTGKRYDLTGRPVAVGNVNMQTLSSPFSEAESPPIIGGVGVPVKTIEGAYEQVAQEQPRSTSIQEKREGVANAERLFREGKIQEAARELTTVGYKGSFGGPVLPSEISTIFGEINLSQNPTAPSPTTPSSTVTPPKERPPLERIIPR